MSIIPSSVVATALLLVLIAAAPSAAQQLKITPLEPNFETIVAQYNPKEIGLDKRVPWNHRKRAESDSPPLEFTGAEPKSMSFELLFDTFDTGENVDAKYIDGLVKLAEVDTNLKRPPMVMVTWGGMKALAGVISEQNVRYTLFLPDGTPVRATVQLRISQTKDASVRGGPHTIATSCTVDTDCPSPQHCNVSICAP